MKIQCPNCTFMQEEFLAKTEAVPKGLWKARTLPVQKTEGWVGFKTSELTLMPNSNVFWNNVIRNF